MHELEPGWWILASIDLTRLPKAQSATHDKASPEQPLEYSSREVAPPQLLLRYLLRAHSIFLLHHATSLENLYTRLPRDAFCDLLDRFWSRYVWNWDVLLHGNPAVDIYNGVKVAAGGELGIGVGEEEWGSGEREVLEDFVSRTEGLVDLVVSRFGDAPVEQTKEDSLKGGEKSPIRQDPWLGTDSEPGSSDGVVFSGVGAISKRSLATVSQWMEWIYKYGEGAYGVGENPSSRHRRKRRPALGDRNHRDTSDSRTKQKVTETFSPPPRRPSDLRRKAMERNAAGPSIPPPLVNAVEKSLDKATSNITSPDASQPLPGDMSENEAASTDDTSVFGTDKMMKYLSLGYGSTWTLSPKGLPRTNSHEQTGDASAATSVNNAESETQELGIQNQNDEDLNEPQLQEIEPTPEISDSEESPFVQRLEQSIGKFIIGLSGDLENAEMLVEEPDASGNGSMAQVPQRIFLRTLTLEVAEAPQHLTPPSQEDDISKGRSSPHGNTKTDASITGSGSVNGRYHKLQVAVYLHQPFIFAFLFTLHTPTLILSSFYRNIHHQLGPLQRPLLRSTDPAKVIQRIADAVGERSSMTTSTAREGDLRALLDAETIHDIIFDPEKLTVRTTIPNIPPPGTFAAEGLGGFSKSSVTVSGSWYTLGIPISNSPSASSDNTRPRLAKSQWTRLEALNVHTQILNTWVATHDDSHGESRTERERIVKTGRGWWVLWMRVPSTSNYGIDGDKEAFLVRKATDHSAPAKRKETGSSTSGSRWLLREQTRNASGSSTGSRTGNGGMAGVTEGVGVDARKWIDGLLSLNR